MKLFLFSRKMTPQGHLFLFFSHFALIQNSHAEKFPFSVIFMQKKRLPRVALSRWQFKNPQTMPHTKKETLRIRCSKKWLCMRRYKIVILPSSTPHTISNSNCSFLGGWLIAASVTEFEYNPSLGGKCSLTVGFFWQLISFGIFRTNPCLSLLPPIIDPLHIFRLFCEPLQKERKRWELNEIDLGNQHVARSSKLILDTFT